MIIIVSNDVPFEFSYQKNGTVMVILIIEFYIRKTGGGRMESRKFKEETGKSPIQFLIACRLEKAKTLLTHTDAGLFEVSRGDRFRLPPHSRKSA
jgi:hypothetical protein